jgi:RNA polymerase sigma-70 factor (ECF subfamily)
MAEADSRNLEEPFVKREESEGIQQTMKTLNRKHRAAVTLKYFDEFSYEEIAQALSIRLGTVKFRQHAVLRILRQESIGGRSRP